MVFNAPTLFEELLDWLAVKVKQALKRARKRWRKRKAAHKPRRKKRGKALSAAGRIRARKRWNGQKAAGKAAKKRVPKPAARQTNVIPFERVRSARRRSA